MAAEIETQLEAFIASNSGGSLRKIEISESTFDNFQDYLAVYFNKIKERTAFIDNVFITLNNNTVPVLTRYNDENDVLCFEYCTMTSGSTTNLTYFYGIGDDSGLSYTVAYMNGEFADSDMKGLLKLGSKISCDIYVLE